MTKKSRHAAIKLLQPYFKTAAADKHLPVIFYMFTDIRRQTTELRYYGQNAEQLIQRAFNVTPKDGRAILPGVVSRKKQVIPAMMTAIQYFQDEQR
jgi:manganese-dependent inorganic pyrophosphatase